jgi:hypothetical protein
LIAPPALAERHVVQRGETLEHVARRHGCSVDAVLRANHLETTLVPAGTVVEVPSCHARPADDAAKAKAALAVIDGTAWTDDTSVERLQPWHTTIGQLGGHLEEGDGIHVRRPQRAYGEPHVVEYLRRAVAEVRALYPDVPTLAIGDLSSERGGELPGHRSHRTGHDVDVGFYFHHATTGFQDAGDDLDLEATWALLVAFARTTDRKDGVEIIFLDYAVQKQLFEFAKARGTPERELAFLLQYPAGKDEQTGLVRHWPNHANHFHVRFR